MKACDLTDGYQILEDGRLWSSRQNKFLKPRKDRNGYISYSLAINGSRKNYYAHRLVAQYFIPRLIGREHVNHIDGNILNNHVLNLEWVTHQENMLHARKYGLMRKNAEKAPTIAKPRSGGNNPNAKLQVHQVFEIRQLRGTSMPLADIADRYGVKPNTIKNIWQRHTWGHI